LTKQTSLGFECIDFAENILELELMPWQKWFLIHALELHPTEVDEAGGPLFRFRKIVLLVGRQNGKSTVMQALTLWRMFVDRCSLVIGTAQDLEIAESLWAECVDMAEEVPELKAEIAKVEKGSGKKALRLQSGETYKVKAASRRGGRGLSGELVLLDELREHQSWDAWGAVTKTTNARERAQIFGISNAGDSTSIVLRHLRKKAHARLGDPDGLSADDAPDVLVDEDDIDAFDLRDDDSLGLFEWSASPGCALLDPQGLIFSNPALGHRIRHSTLMSDASTDPEWVYRTEVLCQWSEGSLEGPFPPDSWERSADEKSHRAEGADIALCVDVSWDRSTSHIGLASHRADGNIHVELIASRTGTEWVKDWLTDDSERSEAVLFAPVAVQAKGAPASSLITSLEDAGVKVVPWGGSDLGAGTGAFYDLVRAAVGEGAAETGVRHRSQPLLNIAAANAATKPAGDAWWWDRRKSAVDVAPLIAVTGATWCLTSAMPEVPKESVYESRGLVTL
jgi:phage terminase large subunit-like protein